MRRRVEDKPTKVIVDKAVVRDPAYLLPTHRSTLSQVPELVGKGGHAQSDHERDVAHAQRALAKREQVEDPRP